MPVSLCFMTEKRVSTTIKILRFGTDWPKQTVRPRADAAKRIVLSGSALFATQLVLF